MYDQTQRLLSQAWRQARQGERVIVALPPGYGKTHGTVEAIAASAEANQVLWFMPETHALSLAASLETHLQARGVSAIRIHQLSEQPSRVRQELLKWPSRTHVKILAHAYLPLLFRPDPPATLRPLQQAQTIVIDENPFQHFLTLSGTPQDALIGGGHSALPLTTYLQALNDAGLLQPTLQSAESTLVNALAAAPSFQDDRQRNLVYLGGDALVAILKTLLHTGSSPDWYRFRAALSTFWLRPQGRPLTAKVRQQRQAEVRRIVLAAQRNLESLCHHHPVHGISLIQLPGQAQPLVRNATFTPPQFGSRGVLHLDAFPHAQLYERWLPSAQVLTGSDSLHAPRVKVQTLTAEHPYDLLTIKRKAVRYGESRARHHAVIQMGLRLLGERVVILAHQRFARRFQAELSRDYAPHTQQVKVLYWRANLGLNEYAGWDAFIVNDSRLPKRVLHLDLVALTMDIQLRQTILEHLEVTDFLQLLHRTRPLTHNGTILLAFDPHLQYKHSLLEETLDVERMPLAIFRGKSEHVLVLQAARLVTQEALQCWGAVPLRLLHLLLRLHPNRPQEAWDDALIAFIDQIRQRQPTLTWLDVKPSPSDPQDRSLVRLLQADLQLTGYAMPLSTARRGRPALSWVWTASQHQTAAEVHKAMHYQIMMWWNEHLKTNLSQ